MKKIRVDKMRAIRLFIAFHPAIASIELEKVRMKIIDQSIKR